jgi:hypothetical protein
MKVASRNLMFRIALTITFLLGITITSISWSCEFDTDCSPGNQCLKSSGEIYGICTGGIDPGNNHDAQPVYSSTDLNNTTGNTCTFDIDCGPGSICLKGNSSIEGACVHN